MSKKIDFFDGAESETTPVLGNLSASNLVSYDSDATYEATEQGAPNEGNLYFNTTDKVIRYYTGTSWVSVVDESTIQTLQNKSIDGAQNTITNIDGDNVNIDASGNLSAGSTQSSLEAHQLTLDDHESRISDNETDITTNTGNISTNTGDIATNTGNIATNAGDISTIQTNLGDKIDASEKGAVNGVATLDGDGTVPAAQLPSYVDDVLEYADLASFPATGETGKIYIALDTNFSYRWSGTVYIDITSKVDTVNGQSGVVSLDTDDIPEGSTNTYFNGKTTTDLPEGTNEYYTEAKVSANVDVAANTTKVSFPEAPIDGSQYARKDGAWDLVSGGGGGGSPKVLSSADITWNVTTGAVTFNSDIFLEVNGLNYSANTIPTSESGFILNADEQVAYVTPNTSNPGGNLSVSVGALTAVGSSDVIIARREGNDLIIGDSTRIEDGRTWKLYTSPNELIFGPYNLTVTGNNGWTTGNAIGIVHITGSQWWIEFQITGTTSSTNSVDITLSGTVGDSSLARQAVVAVGAITTSATNTAQLRQVTNAIEIRGTASSAWYVSGLLFLNGKPTFV